MRIIDGKKDIWISHKDEKKDYLYWQQPEGTEKDMGFMAFIVIEIRRWFSNASSFSGMLW